MPRSVVCTSPPAPRPIVDKLNAELNAIIKDPAISDWTWKSFWSEPGGGTPEE